MIGAPPSVVSDGQIAEMVRLAGSVPAGHFVEVGVFRGGTAWHLAQLTGDDRELHLFDTFSGMPFADALAVERQRDDQHSKLARRVIGSATNGARKL